MAENHEPANLTAWAVSTPCESQGFDTIKVKRMCGTTTQRLSISFRRTVRVADNNKANDLPPDLGPFPVRTYKAFREHATKMHDRQRRILHPNVS
jgi:hypothetical protein